jgi:hypothetical protein
LTYNALLVIKCGIIYRSSNDIKVLLEEGPLITKLFFPELITTE